MVTPAKRHRGGAPKGSQNAKGRKTPPPDKREWGRPSKEVTKARQSIRLLALSYAPKCLKELARLALKAKSEYARIMAIREILDRAYGKSIQPVTGEVRLSHEDALRQIERRVLDLDAKEVPEPPRLTNGGARHHGNGQGDE